jgi:F-box domain
MEHLPIQDDTRADRRKLRIWDRIKHKNSSSPNLQDVGVDNWSTRSLPRLGSFGSPSFGASSRASSKLSPPSTPVKRSLPVSDVILSEKQTVVRDYFSTLPNEVKLHILLYLPLKTIAMVSMVVITVAIANFRCVSSGGHCALMVLCSRLSTHKRSTKILPLPS